MTELSRFPIVGIGASAGGLRALEQFFQAVPPNPGMAFVIITHLAPDRESFLTDILARHTSLTVHVARDGQEVEANCVYVLPPNASLTIKDGALKLHPVEPSRPERSARGVAVYDLVKAQLSGFVDVRGTRIVLAGPHFELKPSATQAVGMALHELATNAVKYGALSSEQGVITIEWGTTASADDDFRMKWIEKGGPEVTPPTCKGFGHNVIVKLVESSVHGRATVVYDKQGLRWELRAPIKNVIESEDNSTFQDSNPGAL